MAYDNELPKKLKAKGFATYEMLTANYFAYDAYKFVIDTDDGKALLTAEFARNGNNTYDVQIVPLNKDIPHYRSTIHGKTVVTLVKDNRQPV